jgi:proteic killer suppression protein
MAKDHRPCSVTRVMLQKNMIVIFRHSGLETLYRTGSTKGIQAAHEKKLARMLAALDSAATLNDLNQPGYRLHPLKGDRKGFWSIWVNGNWRVTFRFVGVDVELVDYEDYH